jgi:DHA1 family tetracycline resistance protein-like MFS transporter
MKGRKSQEILLLTTVLLAYVGASIGVPIFTPLLIGDSMGTIVPDEWTQQSRSILLGILIAVYPLGQFFGSPILGRISDRLGRRPAMIYTLFGAAFGCLITAYAIYSKNIPLLLISRLVTGFLEGNIAVARSSIADVSDGSTKHKNFGRIAAVGTAGITIGPIIGGVLADNSVASYLNPYVPFYFSALLLFVLAVITALFFIETLAPRDTSATEEESTAGQSRVFAMIDRLGHTPALRHFLILWVLIVVVIDLFFLFLPAFLVEKWRMSPTYIALYVASLNIWYIVGSLYLVPFLSARFKTIQVIIGGVFFYSISLVLILIPENSYYLIPIFVLCDLAAAVILVNCFVYISNMAKGAHQGEVMGIALGLRSLGGAGVGLLGGLLLASSASLTIMVSVGVSAVVLALLVLFKVKDPER